VLTLLSPAKTLNFDFDSEGLPLSAPRFEDDIAELLGTCKKLTAPQLRKLMGLSQGLAELNRDRFRTMELPFTESNSKPALLAFGGDVYRGFDAATLSRRDLKWSQRRIRILSGFYGMLRPLDMMQPYRLEMGTRLSNTRGKNLYEFWGHQVTDAINEDLRGRGTRAVVNLASNEYFKSVKPKDLAAPLVTALFKEDREGTIKTISFSAKRARGLMARFIVQNRVDSPEGMKEFNEEGYSYRPDLSDDSTMLFVRDQHWQDQA
jgi:cytoplasmic iron level regulating protein YaaA (DUF328/UPF0246 family)